MTASTNYVLLELADGEYDDREEVLYAEEAFHARTEEGGVALQYASEPGVEPETEFVAGAKIVGVYDEIAEDGATDEFAEHVQ